MADTAAVLLHGVAAASTLVVYAAAFGRKLPSRFTMLQPYLAETKSRAARATSL